MSSHHEESGTVAARPWWVAPLIPPENQEVCTPTTEELILQSRVARQTSLGHFRIPQMPAVAASAVALLARSEPDTNEISRLIHQDQQLAADVMAFSNSSLFAGATRNTNIPQAISRVGFRRTRSLIFGASLRAVIYSGCEVARAEMLWRHSCSCAAISAQIAQNLRCNADDLYLAGLFHDVGKTVVLSVLDTMALRSQHVALRPAFVERTLELFHEAVGAEVVRQWNLPEQVREAVGNHSESHELPMTKPQAIVALANNACKRLNLGEADDGRKIAGPPILNALRATEGHLPTILEGVLEAAKQA